MGRFFPVGHLIIKELKGKEYLLQSRIVKMMDMSSSRISAVLKRMEQYGIIKRERYGITFRVSLIDKKS